MPTTSGPNGIEYDDALPFRRSARQNGFQVVRTIRCDWFNVVRLIDDFVGDAQRAGPRIERKLPELYDDNSDRPLICTSIEISGTIGGPSQDGGKLSLSTWVNGSFTGAGIVELTATHEAVLYDVLSDDDIDKEYQRFTTKRVMPQVENLSIPGGVWKWPDDDPVQEASVKTLSTADISYRWHWVPEINENYLQIQGKVNDAEWDGYDAETLLCDAPDVMPIIAPNGREAFEIEYRFKWRPDGWNKFFRRGDGSGPGFYTVTAADGSGDKPYDTANFDALFDYEATP